MTIPSPISVKYYDIRYVFEGLPEAKDYFVKEGMAFGDGKIQLYEIADVVNTFHRLFQNLSEGKTRDQFNQAINRLWQIPPGSYVNLESI